MLEKRNGQGGQTGAGCGMASSKVEFVWHQRQLLLHHLLSPWRRRGATLLQVGLGSGISPDFFWEGGFDVSALGSDMAALDFAREVTGPKVEYHLGQPDYLPFDDNTFDHVVLMHMGLHSLPVLEEAVRVASRGVIVLEWNRLSLSRFGQHLQGPSQENPAWQILAQKAVWPWKLPWLGHKVCAECRLMLRSILPLPQMLWPNFKAGSPKNCMQKIMNPIHDAVMPLPIGAIMGMRMELSPLMLTPVGIVTEKNRTRSYAEAAVNRVGSASVKVDEV